MNKETCNEEITFGDEEGDNNCTLHCELLKNHDGDHQEGRIFWKDINATRGK